MDTKKNTIRPYTYFPCRENSNLVYTFLYTNKRHYSACKTQKIASGLDQMHQLLPSN